MSVLVVTNFKPLVYIHTVHASFSVVLILYSCYNTLPRTTSFMFQLPAPRHSMLQKILSCLREKNVQAFFMNKSAVRTLYSVMQTVLHVFCLEGFQLCSFFFVPHDVIVRVKNVHFPRQWCSNQYSVVDPPHEVQLRPEYIARCLRKQPTSEKSSWKLSCELSRAKVKGQRILTSITSALN